MTLHNHLIEELYESMDGSSLQYHQPVSSSCEHKHCDSGDILFFICHVSSREHMLKELGEFMGRSSSRSVTTLPCLVVFGVMQVKEI